MMKAYFADVKIGICGNFGENWPKQKIQRFVVKNGGEFVEPEDPRMTHLVCSIKAYESRMFAVQDAIKRSKNSKTLKLATFDWLEDCLQERKKKPVCGSYNAAVRAKEKRRKQKQRNAERAAAVDRDMTHFAKVVSDAKVSYDLPGYHCYVDPTGFLYDITLTRTNIWDNTNQKVILRLYEAHESPSAYACYSSVFNPDGKDARHVHALPQSDFERAFKAFEEAFKERTTHDWCDRANANGFNEDGSKRHIAYTYRQPSLGPLGMDLPPGRRFVYPQQDEGEEEDIVLVNTDDTDDFEKTQLTMRGRGNTHTKTRMTENDASGSNNDDEQYEAADEGDLGGAMQLDLPVHSFHQPDVKRASRQLQAALHFDLNDIPAATAFPTPMPSYGFSPINTQEYTYGSAQVNPIASDKQSGIVTWDWSGSAGHNVSMQ